MPSITAAVATTAGQPLEFMELALDEPRRDEVLVRMVSVGLCHTDLVVRDTPFPPALPVVLGHEGAGIVEQVGSSVTTVAVGDRVALSFGSCGTCRKCRTGHPALCDRFKAYNFGGSRPDSSPTLRAANGRAVNANFFSQSSFATYALAHASNAVRISEEDDIDLVGPLGCGIQTGAGTVMNILRPRPASALAVFGAGGVGLSGLLAAAAVGCTTLVAVDVNEDRLTLAKELGATATLNPLRDNIKESLLELGGLDFALDTTGRTSLAKAALDALNPGGVLALLGLYTPDGDGLDVAAIPHGRSVIAVIEGDSIPQVTIPALLDLHRAGRFPFEKLVTFYPFDRINDAIADMESGRTVKPIIRF
jgi:aryl-alcohol dehydrogenase